LNIQATVNVLSIQIGQKIYIYPEMVINCITPLIVLEEGIRTTGWRGLGVWDYVDIRSLMLSTCTGGEGFVGAVEGTRGNEQILGMHNVIVGYMKVKYERDKGSLILGNVVSST
jgi:hypothetical protein